MEKRLVLFEKINIKPMETRTVLFEKTCKSYWFQYTYSQCEDICFRKNTVKEHTFYFPYFDKLFALNNYSYNKLINLTPYEGTRRMLLFLKEIKK